MELSMGDLNPSHLIVNMMPTFCCITTQITSVMKAYGKLFCDFT
jgi:hypothetical protein